MVEAPNIHWILLLHLLSLSFYYLKFGFFLRGCWNENDTYGFIGSDIIL